MSRKSVLRAWKATGEVAWDFAAGAPQPLLACLFLRLLNAARPGLVAFITAGFVNGLTQGQGALKWAVAFAATEALELLTNMFSHPAQEWFHNSVTLRVQHRVLARTAQAPLYRFLDAGFYDRVTRATRDLSGRLERWINTLLGLFYSSLSTIGIVGAVFALGGGGALVGVLIVSSAVRLLTSGPIARIEVETSRRTATPIRRAKAWSYQLSERRAASEVRLFGLQRWILGHWGEAYRSCTREYLRAAKGQLSWNCVSTVASVVAYGVILSMVASIAMKAGPSRAAGVFTGLLLAAESMHGFLRGLAGATSSMHAHAGVIGDLIDLFAESEESEQPATKLPAQPVAVTLKDVIFRYPTAESNALDNFTVHITPGEVVALVGPNGAGKSTLAALILGLYKPASGTIRVEGADESDGPRGSAVFQDFVRYLLPVRDNVGFGDLQHLDDDPVLQQALREAGSHLENELATWLSTEFGDRDLSGGEWLRIAIARGLLARSGLIVLDEPTAAIDPLAEVELVRRLLALGKDRTTIVVSHRLGIARLADRILVMDQGRLVEQGTHEQLLAANGLFAQMWRAQASWYTP